MMQDADAESNMILHSDKVAVTRLKTTYKRRRCTQEQKNYDLQVNKHNKIRHELQFSSDFKKAT